MDPLVQVEVLSQPPQLHRRNLKTSQKVSCYHADFSPELRALLGPIGYSFTDLLALDRLLLVWL